MRISYFILGALFLGCSHSRTTVDKFGWKKITQTKGDKTIEVLIEKSGKTNYYLELDRLSGKLDGLFLNFDNPEGRLTHKGYYSNGKMIGQSFDYFYDGTIKSMRTELSNEMFRVIFFDKYGKAFLEVLGSGDLRLTNFVYSHR